MGQRQPVVELVEQVGEIPGTGFEVLFGIRQLAAASALAGGRHQLHQATGAAVGNSLGVVVRT